MHEFIARYQDKITGMLSGFDRLVLRGTLRSIAHREGMQRYLWANDVLLKDFGARRAGQPASRTAQTVAGPPGAGAAAVCWRLCPAGSRQPR